MSRITENASTYTKRRSIASDTNSQTLAYADPDRVGLTIFNSSTQDLYVLLQDDPAAAPSDSNCTVIIATDAYYEVPFGWRGQVHGAWASANGTAQVTEFF